MKSWLLNLVVNTIIPTCFLILGNIGNILTIAIFVRKSLRKYSSSVYFVALAIADLFALNVECMQFYAPSIINYFNKNSEFGNYWSHSYNSKIQVRTHFKIGFMTSFGNNTTSIFQTTPLIITNAVHLTDFLCKLQSLSFYTAYQMSSWLLVLLSFDRCLSISFPLNKICKPKVAKWFAGFCVLTIIVLNSHGLLFVQLVETEFHNHTINELSQSDKKEYPSRIKTTTSHIYSYTCGVNDKKYPFYSKFYYKHWNTFDFIFSVAVPSVLLAIFNTKIIITMHKSVKKLKSDYNVLKRYTSGVLSRKYRHELGNFYLKKISKLKQMNVMLISAVLTFFLFYAPYSIYYIVLYNTQINGFSFNDDETKDLWGQLLLLWSLLNVTIDFYVFYLTGSTIFRSELKKIKKSLLNRHICRHSI